MGPAGYFAPEDAPSCPEAGYTQVSAGVVSKWPVETKTGDLVRLARILLPALLTLPLGAVTAGAEEDGFEPDLTPQTAWFTCDGASTPDYQANYRLGDATPTWAFEEPTGAFPADHCGSLHQSLFGGTEQESPYDLSFAGTFEGNLDTITVRLHNAFVGTARGASTMPISVRLTVDELSVFGIQEFTGTDVDGGTFETVTHTGPRPRDMVATLVPGDHGATDVYEFDIAGLDYLLQDDLGDKRIVLTIATPLSGSNAQNVWAWGTAETDSSITFNAEVTPDRRNSALPRAEREEHHYPD
jgi:hypothetical protein